VRPFGKGLRVKVILTYVSIGIYANGLSLIRPESKIFNTRHDGTLSIRNFLLIMAQLNNPVLTIVKLSNFTNLNPDWCGGDGFRYFNQMSNVKEARLNVLF
jgi:hypothetical protein